MRPRRFCRGKQIARFWAILGGDSFNEAPAILPGKAASACQPDSARERDASMRPRRFCRGKPSSAATTARPTHCFNEAPAILPGKASDANIVHGSGIESFNEAPAILPGKAAVARGGRDRFHSASMRPRRFCRGKPESVLAHMRHGIKASMRPRRFCRGKKSSPVLEAERPK